MNVKSFVYAVFVCCLLFFVADFCRSGQGTSGTAVAYFPEKNYIFNPVVEGTEIIHDFILQNKGSETLLVQKVTTD
jgi:hypothetical protein